MASKVFQSPKSRILGVLTMKWQFKSSSLSEENIMTKMSLGGMDRAVCTAELGNFSVFYFILTKESHFQVV